MSDIVKVPFRDGHIEAIGDDNGKVHVVIKRVCETIGVAFQAQLTKLKAKPWATVTMIVTVAEDGRKREVACIALESLPMWMATIEPSKVAPEVRPILEAFQCEAHDVLRDYFFGRQRVAASLPTEFFTELSARLELLQHSLLSNIDARINERVKAELSADPRIAVASYLSAKELLIEEKVPSRKRRGLVVSVSARLREHSQEALRCPRTRTWLFPAAEARKWMREHGVNLVRAHIDSLCGQTVIDFDAHRKRNNKLEEN